MLRLKLLSKQNLYLRILIYYLLFFIAITFCADLVKNVQESDLGKYAAIIILVLWQLLILYSIEIFRVFGVSTRLINVLRALFALGVVSAVTIINPFIDPLPYSLKLPIFGIFHLATILISIAMSYHILKDIFSSRKTKMDHIWGAVVTYFFGIMIFSDIYEFGCLFQPGLLGEQYVIGMPNYINCILFSVNAASGLDSLYPEAHGVLKNLSNVEHIVSNLFLIVILGRLLSVPLEK